MACGLLTAPAVAEIIVLDIVMDQAQETDVVLPVEGGNGIGSVVVNTDTNEIAWAIIYEGLSGPAIGAHFHGPADRGEGSGVALNVGTISGLGPVLTGVAQLEQEQIEEILDGRWYINLHTELNKPGEIRGQVVDE